MFDIILNFVFLCLKHFYYLNGAARASVVTGVKYLIYPLVEKSHSESVLSLVMVLAEAVKAFGSIKPH